MRDGLFQVRIVAATALWVATTLSTEGCLFQKKPRAYVPPPVRPPAPVALDPLPLLGPPPDVEVALVELPESEPSSPALLPPPPKQPAPPRPRTPAVAAAPKPTPPPPDAPPTLPRITQMLTTQQIGDYTRQLDEALNYVSEALKTAGKKNLTAEQKDTVEKITAFQKQAVQAREEDLVTAVNYARRADLLAKDLLARLP
jgi:hypothetical protein